MPDFDWKGAGFAVAGILILQYLISMVNIGFLATKLGPWTLGTLTGLFLGVIAGGWLQKALKM